MVQHLLLMMVAPPLLLLGAPLVPLLRGLPARVAKDALGPFLAWPALRARRPRAHAPGRLLARARRSRPGSGTCPALYQLALRLARLARGRARQLPRRRPALLVAGGAAVAQRARAGRAGRCRSICCSPTSQNTVFAAFLAFSERCSTRPTPRCRASAASSALDDQVGGGRADVGAVRRSIFLVPAAVHHGAAVLSPRGPADAGARCASARAAAAAVRCPAPADARLRCCAGRATRRVLRRARCCSLAAPVVADGLLGPRHEPDESRRRAALDGLARAHRRRRCSRPATSFCIACPFMLPRDLAARSAAGAPPLAARWLRTKWLAVGRSWWSSSGPTRRSVCGTARARPRG